LSQKKLQEQKRENQKQRRVIEEQASRKEQVQKEKETERNRETMSGGSTKKKKKKKKKKSRDKPTVEVEDALELTVEVDDDLETCQITKHKTDKQGEVRVEVKWDGSSKRDWQYLYDMWADYPSEVKEYKKKNKCKGKLWKVPIIDNVEYFVRILGMIGGAEDVTKAKFCVLANNGYKFDGVDCVKYHELQADDSVLLQAFLDSVENSPEADDASIA
jgi:hypothetical protein